VSAAFAGLLSGAAGAALVIAAAVFLSRSFVLHWLARNIAKFQADLNKDLERMKTELSASAAKKQRLETNQEAAISELYPAFREAVFTAEHFSQPKHGQGFKNSDGNTATDLIGDDRGSAYRKLDEKGLFFLPALVTAMRDLLGTIREIQQAVTRGNEPPTSAATIGELTSAANERAAAWDEAAALVRDELNPQWAKVTAEFQRMLGIDVDLDAGCRK
jgi:hypothetical protein